jgi:hypothetical protein
MFGLAIRSNSVRGRMVATLPAIPSRAWEGIKRTMSGQAVKAALVAPPEVIDLDSSF